MKVKYTSPRNPAQKVNDIVFPEAKPISEGYVKVSDMHELWYAKYGNPRGVPVVILHGGPGFSNSASYVRFFDPIFYRIILYEQRGANRSKPVGELEENETNFLVDDLDILRKHLKIDKWLVSGGSWGSSLSLLYGEKYPEKCLGFLLRGTFILHGNEYKQIWHGIQNSFPERHEALTEILSIEERDNLIESYYKRLMHPDPIIHMQAARKFVEYDLSCCPLLFQPSSIEKTMQNDAFVLGAARIFTYYCMNNFFLEENYIYNNLAKISHLPMTIIHGRHDVVCLPKNGYKLHKALPKSELIIVEDGAHSASEIGIATALLNACNKMKLFLQEKNEVLPLKCDESEKNKKFLDALLKEGGNQNGNISYKEQENKRRNNSSREKII